MKQILLTGISIAFLGSMWAQGVKISPTPGTPDPSAGLEVDYTDKGALFPRMTSAQRLAIANPATGLLVYQTNTPEGFWYNSGTPGAPNWVQVIQNPVNTNVDMSNNFIQNLPLPVNNADAVNKAYVDALVASGGGGTPGGVPTMMSNESGSQFTFADGVNYCNNLNESGHTDWRMPTLDELAYFYGGTSNSNFVWTKTITDAADKENPVNQNYITARLNDGKWRGAGEVIFWFPDRSASGSMQTPSTWTTMATFTAPTSTNVFIPATISFTGSNNSACCSSTASELSAFRLKFNYADGSIIYSSTYTRAYSSTTFFSSSNLNPHLIPPMTSIELQIQAQGVNSPNYTTTATLTISGYEITLPKRDGATFFVRCVR